MPTKRASNRSRGRRSLVTTLAFAFMALSLIAILVAGSLQLYFNLRSQQAVVAGQQRLIALEAANTVKSFIQERFGELEAAVKFGNPSTLDSAALTPSLEKLLGLQPAFRHLVWFDTDQGVISQASRLSQMGESETARRFEADLFVQTEQGDRYISPVYIDDATFEPLIVMAVPVRNVFGDFQGTLLAEVNLKFMWDLVDQLEIGETGLAYVVDRQGKLLAFGDISRVLAGENLSYLSEVAEFVNRENASVELEEDTTPITGGINGAYVLAAYIPLGTPDWAVVTELPVEEAYAEIIRNVAISGAIMLIVAGLAAGAGAYLARRLAAPLLSLTDTATRIAGGEINLQAGATGSAEVAQLAETFNQMTAQLRDLIDSLEQQVAARTHRLETAAVLSERLTAILHLEELLAELVDQVKDNFDYYHAHIYLLDERREKLVVTAGTGQAGEEMKARGHSIALNVPTSLVARAARSGGIVRVDNVREAPDWLPNPLLPDTYSEMAVPIVLEGQVVGVLDVQQDKVAGLDEGDAGLLRSLANQAAVALRNARLFEQVETALAEAKAAQERYIEQTWQKSGAVGRHGQYVYAQPEAAPLDPAKQQAMAAMRQQAQREAGPAIVTVGDAEQQKSLVAPINLRDKTIGAVQLYSSRPDRSWSEDDLAVIEAVVDQLAQTAEGLRLFEETRSRAGRERTIREITEKMRAAVSLEQLIKTTSEELGQRLSAGHAVVELGLESAGRQAGEGNGHGH